MKTPTTIAVEAGTGGVFSGRWVRWLRRAGMLAAAAAGPVLAAAHLEVGPMLGHVGPDEVRVWAKVSGPARVEVEVEVAEEGVAVGERAVLRGGSASEPGGNALVRVTGLWPARRYRYNVLVDGVPALSAPLPSFVTAPSPGAPGRLRFVFGSCVGLHPFESAATWGDMAARTNFDLLLMLGDNHYADTTAARKQLEAYYAHRRLAGFQEIGRRTPVYGIWDDHDFATNDSDGSAPGKEESLRTFRLVWPNPGGGQPDDPGVYFRFSRGDVDFFLLDGRYHRSRNAAPDDGRKTMLGTAQLAWLKRELAASRAKVKFLASGSEWESTGHKDSWGSFAREREELFRFIDDHRIEGVLLLSGDRHFTGGYQVHGRFIEVTSGPLGSTDNPVKNFPEMFLNLSHGKLYSLFDVDTTVSPPRVQLEVYRVGHGLAFRRAFSWDEVQGRRRIPSLPPSRPDYSTRGHR